MDYVRLAYALLDSGDSTGAVVAFLRAEYGLPIDDARETVISAQTFPTNAKRAARLRRRRHDDRSVTVD